MPLAVVSSTRWFLAVGPSQVANRFEHRAFHPTVIPVDVAVNGVDRAKEAGADGFADIAEMRRPTCVLIHGQSDAHLVGDVG
jgi:hypothetical protein